MTRTRALTVLVPLALLVAACGDDDEVAPIDEPAATDSTTTTTEEEEGSASGAMVEVASSELGEILVSGEGTLYVFTPDDAGPSTCYDQCAQTWPPLLATGSVSGGEGIDETMLGTAPRDDGSEQVIVNGWPLYFFANDTAPGDVNGQGVGDNWWVIGPDGQPIEDS